MTLIATYAIRLMKFPVCSIIKDSLEKVEKVVNLPQPIKTVFLMLSEIISRRTLR